MPAKVADEDVGLFTPGHKIKTGAATSSVRGAAAGGGGTAGKGAAAPTCGGTNLETQEDAGPPVDCLTVTLTTDGPPGDYDRAGAHPNNGVVWIEDEQGQYAAGLESWVIMWKIQGNPTWLLTKQRIGCDDPDIITGPTRVAHETHTLVWKCQNTKRKQVLDGNYRLWVEVQIDEKHQQQAVSFPFTKGREPWTMTYPAGGGVKELTLKYTPPK